jgi:transcriptional regulator with XRE-family HTH domain
LEIRGPLLGANRHNQELLLSLLRVVREEKGLHQVDIADALARPQSFVSKYEAGARRLDLLEPKEVCDAVGIELTDFVRRFAALLEEPAKDKHRGPKPTAARVKPRR